MHGNRRDVTIVTLGVQLIFKDFLSVNCLNETTKCLTHDDVRNVAIADQILILRCGLQKRIGRSHELQGMEDFSVDFVLEILNDLVYFIVQVFTVT